MDTQIEMSAQGVKYRAEQHDPEDQIGIALQRAGQWLYKRLRLRRVGRSEFIKALIHVIQEEEPLRFALDPQDRPTTPLTFDGTRSGGLHPYINRALAELGHAPVRLPENCTLRVYVSPAVTVHTYSTDDPYNVCIYPRYVPATIADQRSKMDVTEASPHRARVGVRNVALMGCIAIVVVFTAAVGMLLGHPQTPIVGSWSWATQPPLRLGLLVAGILSTAWLLRMLLFGRLRA